MGRKVTKQTQILFHLQIADELALCANLEERLDKVSMVIVSANTGLSPTDVKIAAKSYYEKLRISERYEVKQKYNGDVTLIAAEKSSSETGLDDTYGLKQVTHLTLLRPMELSIKFDTVKSGWSNVYIERVIISKFYKEICFFL